MTTQEYIEDLISQITDAVEPNSITPAMVGTVLGYLLGRASDNSAAVQQFVGNLSGYIQRGEAGVVSGSMLEDGSITRQKLSSALVEYLSGLGNVTFGYKMPATVGQTAYLSDDGLSGGQVLLFFQDSYAADEDGDVFEDLDGSDLMESLLDALEQWDRWEEMQEKYSIFDYGIVYDEDSAYIGCLYFRSSNPYFAVDADCPNSMEAETGEEFSANSSHMQPIDKRRNAGCLYVDMSENTVYRYTTEHTPFGEYVAVGGGSDVTVDQALGNSDNPVANRAINAAIAALSSSLSGKESTENRVASITSLSDNSHYPSAKAVYDLYHALEVVMSLVDGRVTQNSNSITQNQTAINGLDNDLSSLANRVTSAENSLDGMGIDGDEVYIGNHTVNVRDFVLGYYIKGYKNEMTLSLTTLTGTNQLSFNMGVSHYDLEAVSGIDMVNQVTAILGGLGYSPTVSQTGSTSWKIVFLSESSIGVVQKTGGDQYATISNTAVGASEGFYSDSGYHTMVSGSVGKLYIDVSTNMLYRYVGGNSYEPLNAQPFLSGGYNATTQALVLNFAGGTVSIPVGDMIPDFTAGKGISISGGVVSQNYRVVSQDEIEDYLAHGTEDGIIRYVYEEE